MSDKNDLQDIILAAKKLKKTPSLGKGISALLGEAQTSKEVNIPSEFQVVKINLDLCVPSRYQARKTFNQEELQALSDSIKEKGVIQPVLLRKIEDGKFEIIAGERRCRASILAGFTEISAIVLDINDKEVMEIGLIENLHRKDLDALEEAYAYKNLCEEFNYTHEDIAKTIGKTRSYVSNYLRILNLPLDILQLIKENKITVGHAKMLVNAEDPIALSEQILKNSLSVRSLENLVKIDKEKNLLEKKKIFDLTSEISDWQSKIKHEFSNIKIKVTPKDTNSGEVKIKYSNLEDLKKLLKI